MSPENLLIVLSLYNKGKTHKEIAYTVGYNEVSIQRAIKLLNPPKRTLEQTRERNKLFINKENIIGLYKSGKSGREIGELYGVSASAILIFLKKIGIKPRVGKRILYDIDESFFEIIDTEEKAYFLGFLYADGTMDDSTCSIKMELGEKDKEILEKLNNCIKSNAPLGFSNWKRRFPTKQNSYILRMNRKKMFDDLIRLGCVPRKSLILEFPNKNQVPSHLIRHFVRGYFDGDGCIHVKNQYKKKKNSVTIVGSKPFCETLYKILTENLGIKVSIKKDSKSSIYYLSICAINDIKILSDYFYIDCKIKLERKYNIFLEFIKTRYIPFIHNNSFKERNLKRWGLVN